jgi:hypothetical protein
MFHRLITAAIFLATLVLSIGCDIQTPQSIQTCEDLEPEIIRLSEEKSGPFRAEILKLYNVELVSESGDEMTCRGDARLSTGGDELEPIEFYLFTDAEGDTFFGYKPGTSRESDIGDSSVTPRSEVDSTPVTTGGVVLRPTATATPRPVPQQSGSMSGDDQSATQSPTPTEVPTPPATFPPPTPLPTPLPSATPVPTATPIQHSETPPVVRDQSAFLSVADLVWHGTEFTTQVLGEFSEDWVVRAEVQSPHDTQRGIWSFGIEINYGRTSDHIWIQSNNDVGVNWTASPRVAKLHNFFVNDGQFESNNIAFRKRSDALDVYVNGTLAAEITDLPITPVTLALHSNYTGTEIVQGFVMLVPKIEFGSSLLFSEQRLDVPVVDSSETTVALDINDFNEFSARLENPFKFSNDALDFGFRFLLPNSNRSWEFKYVRDLNGHYVVRSTISFTTNGATFWSETLPIQAAKVDDFDFQFYAFDETPHVVLDGTGFVLTSANLDLDFEQFSEIEVFVNGDQIPITSIDARFLASPYVRLTEFGAWVE